jgi:alpha-L-fucosidase
MQRALWLMICALGVVSILHPQHSVDGYVPETDPLAQQKLVQWQDIKFGLIMHWGTYSVW